MVKEFKNWLGSKATHTCVQSTVNLEVCFSLESNTTSLWWDGGYCPFLGVRAPHQYKVLSHEGESLSYMSELSVSDIEKMQERKRNEITLCKWIHNHANTFFYHHSYLIDSEGFKSPAKVKGKWYSEDLNPGLLSVWPLQAWTSITNSVFFPLPGESRQASMPCLHPPLTEVQDFTVCLGNVRFQY